MAPLAVARTVKQIVLSPAHTPGPYPSIDFFYWLFTDGTLWMQDYGQDGKTPWWEPLSPLPDNGGSPRQIQHITVSHQRGNDDQGVPLPGYDLIYAVDTAGVIWRGTVVWQEDDQFSFAWEQVDHTPA
jgi:hypothetical protein